jgi:hypothetical protein
VDPQINTPGIGRADVWVFDANNLGNSLGGNPINIVHAVMAGLRALRRPVDIAAARGRDVRDIAPRPMLEAMAAAEVTTAARRAELGLEEDGGG